MLSNSLSTQSEFEPIPRKSRRWQRLITFLVILAILAGLSYRALWPLLRELIQPEFDIVIISVTTQTDCEAPERSLSGPIASASSLCVCGYLSSSSEITYSLVLKDSQENTLQKTRVHNQSPGTFCRLFELDALLDGGRYVLDVQTIRQEVHTSRWFMVTPPVANPQQSAMSHEYQKETH